jgi:UDP-glucuronate 4-epimerase
MVRDFTFIDDIVEGVIRVLDTPSQKKEDLNNDPSQSKTAPFKVYNIGNSSPVELMDYIRIIEQKLGKEATKEYLPMQMGDVPITEADVNDLVRDIGYKPSTSIEKGIGAFIEWYKNYY